MGAVAAGAAGLALIKLAAAITPFAAWAPGLGVAGAALALAGGAWALAPGTAVAVGDGEALIPARVTELPFVKPA